MPVKKKFFRTIINLDIISCEREGLSWDRVERRIEPRINKDNRLPWERR